MSGQCERQGTKKNTFFHIETLKLSLEGDFSLEGTAFEFHCCIFCSLKLLSWDVGKINPQKLPSLKGSVSLQAGTLKPDENPTINLQFKIQQLAISGK